MALSTRSRRKSGGGFSAASRRVSALGEFEEHGLLSRTNGASNNAASAEVRPTAHGLQRVDCARPIGRLNWAYPATENVYLVGFAANSS